MSILPTDRQTMRLLKILTKAPGTLSPTSTQHVLLVECGEHGAVTIGEQALRKALDAGFLLRQGDDIVLAPDLAQSLPLSGKETGLVRGADKNIALVEINTAESPLSQLFRRRDRRGRPYIDRAEFEAGEQLRSDFTRASLTPRVTQNWSGVSGGGQSSADSAAQLAAGTLAARKRVEMALDAVGPELSGPLLDICCFLKGLEQVEAERGWPVRSAKVMLKAGLSTLARHYAPQRKPRPRHWGAEGYRPENI